MCMQRARGALELGKDLGLIAAVLGLYLVLAVVHRGRPLPGDRDGDD